MIGAIFIKFGRAPTTFTTLINAIITHGENDGCHLDRPLGLYPEDSNRGGIALPVTGRDPTCFKSSAYVRQSFRFSEDVDNQCRAIRRSSFNVMVDQFYFAARCQVKAKRVSVVEDGMKFVAQDESGLFGEEEGRARVCDRVG